jgi:hypothetical protein
MLFADIVDSTETLGRLGDSRWAELRAQHRDAVAEALAVHGGREIGSSGDDLFAVFDVPIEALRCAVALRAAADKLGLQLRAGVHCGEIEFIGPDVAGLNVHVTARVMAAADPGQVLVSSTVRDLVGGAGVVFDDRGFHSLRGVSQPWRLFVVDPLSVSSSDEAAGTATLQWAPLPAAVAAEENVPFVGRTTESAQLDELWIGSSPVRPVQSLSEVSRAAARPACAPSSPGLCIAAVALSCGAVAMTDCRCRSNRWSRHSTSSWRGCRWRGDARSSVMRRPNSPVWFRVSAS